MNLNFKIKFKNENKNQISFSIINCKRLKGYTMAKGYLKKMHKKLHENCLIFVEFFTYNSMSNLYNSIRKVNQSQSPRQNALGRKDNLI